MRSVFLALAVVLGSSGCAIKSDPAPSSIAPKAEPPRPMVGMPAPQFIDVAELDERGVTPLKVNLGRAVVISARADYDKWTAQGHDEGIVTFIAGKNHGSFQTNPGFELKQVGETETTLTDGKRTYRIRFLVRPPIVHRQPGSDVPVSR